MHKNTKDMKKEKIEIECDYCRKKFSIYVIIEISSLKILCPHCGEQLYPQFYVLQGID